MIPATIQRTVPMGWDRASLDRIARPDAALAIWWRNVPALLRSALPLLDLDAVDDLSVDIDAHETIEAALRSAGYPDAIVAPLAADIDLLLRRHAALTGEDRLHVRLEVIDTDACRRFHADYVTLRLLCTYIGPGTQWCCVDGQDAICEVPTGAVSVFKGRMLPDPPTVLHRSPPIIGTGHRRLVLVIDPATPPRRHP